MNERLHLRLGGDRITSRQIDELIGIARGLLADGKINQAEIEFLQKWLAANADISNQPLIHVLYHRVNEILADGVADAEEQADLFDTLNRFVSNDTELGEDLKPSSLPLCNPAPTLTFANRSYCFTGTFNFGQRKACEQVITERGGTAGSLTRKTHVLVIGSYVTSSWKHSSFGDKIERAVEWRASGAPISIVSEAHWRQFI